MIDVSIIIPVYNTEKYLRKCIDSLLGQSFENFEVIFVNDGTTDDSVSVIESYDDKRIKVMNQMNQGQAVARNNAIKVAKGEYLTFVDSDDYIDHYMIEKLFVEAKNSNADISWCDMITYNEKNTCRLKREFDSIDDNKINYLLNNAGPCAKLIRTRLLIENNLYFLTGHFYEDIAIVPAYALYTDSIVYVDEALYYYRLHDGSTMKQSIYNKKMNDIFPAMESLSTYFEKTNAYNDELEYLYIKHLLHAASLRFFPFKDGKLQIKEISNIIKTKYPKWRDNKYYKYKNNKFKFVCNLLYYKLFLLLSILLKQ